eukprot:TRINITY_DN6953_c0_g1_i2.p3 TRINITY_DN6953_c0_g1~~TRINITY_DN6953_c0_g1_i2.p3  ORF type:complete len:108 (+),score=41.08 TRINITY_DN6953_c0_g1_i2:108-431(+)
MAIRLAAAVLALLAVPGAAVTMRRAMAMDCPLCVAEERCHVSCGEIKQTNPGSEYCLKACTGGHPDDVFDATWFTAKDQEFKEEQDRDARMQELGKELEEDVEAGRR